MQESPASHVAHSDRHVRHNFPVLSLKNVSTQVAEHVLRIGLKSNGSAHVRQSTEEGPSQLKH